MCERFGGAQRTDAFVMLIEIDFGPNRMYDAMVSAQWTQKQWHRSCVCVCQFRLLSLFEAVETTGAESSVCALVYLPRSLLSARRDDVIDAHCDAQYSTNQLSRRNERIYEAELLLLVHGIRMILQDDAIEESLSRAQFC